MKQGTITALITIIAAGAILMMSCSNDSQASDVMKEGAELGSWTMDYKAALALAKEKDLPIMLNFTGSDWCGWCIRMDRGVFAKKEWSRWATENLLLVTLDFPKGKNIVPEKYQNRNRQLQRQYMVRGYPPYVIVDVDGDGEIAQKSRSMKPEDAKAYQRAHAELRTTKAELETWMRTQPNRNEENLEKLDAYDRRIEKLSDIEERY